MKFSQRIGKYPIKTIMDKETISPELRNSLWTLMHELINDLYRRQKQYNKSLTPASEFFRDIWIFFYKRPIDNLPWSYGSVDITSATATVRDWFFKAEWYEIFDLIEFVSKYEASFCEACNGFMKEEMSAYRFVNNQIVEITSDEEIAEIEQAIENTDRFAPVRTHLETSIKLLSDKKKPDYRNSVKESISAVEAIAKIITQNAKATLGQALHEIEKKHSIPNSLKSSFSALYGYTSDASGIRHSLLDNSVPVEQEEARFMLVACSAFINYLIAKL